MIARLVLRSLARTCVEVIALRSMSGSSERPEFLIVFTYVYVDGFVPASFNAIFRTTKIEVWSCSQTHFVNQPLWFQPLLFLGITHLTVPSSLIERMSPSPFPLLLVLQLIWATCFRP